MVLKRWGIKYEWYWVNWNLHYYGRFIDAEGVVRQGQMTQWVLNWKWEENTVKYVYTWDFVDWLRQGFGRNVTSKDIYEGEFL